MMVERYDVNDTYPHVVTFGLGDKPAEHKCNDRGNRVTLGENCDNLVGYMHGWQRSSMGFKMNRGFYE